ncbi:endonuclease domain-containing protein, partial [Xanthomonas oryzae pv. oryzae]
MSAFDKHQISTFRFVRCALDAQTGVATLVYAFDQGPELVETVAVPGAPFALGGANATAVQ